MQNNIKKSVSLYSYQEEYFLGKMSLEDCIATSARLGATGIEVVSEQNMRGFPNLPDAFYEQWHSWMDKYETVPVCHDMFLDTKMFKGRLMTDDEMVESVVRDLKHANKLGCKVMRCIVITPPEIMEKCAPYAEKYDVKMGIEIHAPWSFDHEWIIRHTEVMERLNSPYLGYIPDFGIFDKVYPRLASERALRDGAQENIVNHIVDRYNLHKGMGNIIEEVKSMGGNEVDLAMAYDATRRIFSDPRKMLEYMPRIVHVHAKCNDMLEDYTEYSVPYDEIILVLIEGGYEGYLSTEYEGNRHIQDAFAVDSVEQVRRHQVMLTNLIGH